MLVRAGGDGFELIAGERRWRASQRMAQETITRVQQALFYRFGAFLHVGFVLAAGTDGRDAQKFEELAEKAVFIFILIIFPG